jgi:molybdenum cofactor cytidylyltransferase
MHLFEALRLFDPRAGKTPGTLSLALTGAGGKTSALFYLARELIGMLPLQTVLLTTTTHLLIEQTRLSDKYFQATSPRELDFFEDNLPDGVLVITGKRETRDGVMLDKVSGLDEATLERLRQVAERRNLPLLIEADGSRRRPLKAPASHEPVVPEWVDCVVVVAGLSGVNQPLTETWVHRPQLFSQISGLSLGETLAPQAISRVLEDPGGGLWRLPHKAQKMVLLNQARTIELAAAGLSMAEQLINCYDRVVVANLPLPGKGGSLVDNERQVIAVHEKIAGIILAAGGSKRMENKGGAPIIKQLLPWKEQPLVRHVAQAALEAGLDPVIMVVGSHGNEVAAAVQGLPLTIVYNEAWETGQSSSVIRGMTALQESIRFPAVGGAVFLLADQPQIPSSLVRSLVEKHAQTMSLIIAPQAGGRRGNPVLFDRLLFEDLLGLSGDKGGRTLFSTYPVEWLPWLDESILLDIDTLQDYDHLQQPGQ